jgi:small subunit ribosomal protein S6
MILVNNQEVRKGWQACKQSVVDLFTKHSAQVVSARRWDERRLTYPIKGQQRATYLLVYFKSPHLAPNAIRRELEFSEVVLRHQILKCEEIPAEAMQPEAAFDETRAGEDVAPTPPPAPPAPENNGHTEPAAEEPNP